MNALPLPSLPLPSLLLPSLLPFPSLLPSLSLPFPLRDNPFRNTVQARFTVPREVVYKHGVGQNELLEELGIPSNTRPCHRSPFPFPSLPFLFPSLPLPFPSLFLALPPTGDNMYYFAE